jgi:ABC-type amino acid transport substrate-binding protein
MMHSYRTPIMTRCLNLRRRLLALLSATIALFSAADPVLAAGVLDEVRQTGKLSLGYRADERPFSFANSAGAAPGGFSVALCERIADAVKTELKLPALQIEWVPVTAADRFERVRQGRIQIDCGTDTPTLQRRTVVDFSIPIAMAGISAVMRADGDWRVRDILSGRTTPAQPVWRGNPGDFGGSVTFAVIGGSTIEKDLEQALAQRRISVKTLSVSSFAEGVQAVLDRRATVMFGERPVLADAALRGPGAGQLNLLDRRFSRTTLALALPLGDTDLRLLVDRTLSRLYRSPDFGALYAASFGAMEAPMAEFFQLVALPE